MNQKNVVNRCRECGRVFQHRREDRQQTCSTCAPPKSRERYGAPKLRDRASERAQAQARARARDTLLARTPLHVLYPAMLAGLARLQEARPSFEAWKE